MLCLKPEGAHVALLQIKKEDEQGSWTNSSPWALLRQSQHQSGIHSYMVGQIISYFVAGCFRATTLKSGRRKSMSWWLLRSHTRHKNVNGWALSPFFQAHGGSYGQGTWESKRKCQTEMWHIFLFPESAPERVGRQFSLYFFRGGSKYRLSWLSWSWAPCKVVGGSTGSRNMEEMSSCFLKRWIRLKQPKKPSPENRQFHCGGVGFDWDRLTQRGVNSLTIIFSHFIASPYQFCAFLTCHCCQIT